MFDRHQAEMTVMQLTGHSHTVHQSMSVPQILPCPILSAKPAYVIPSHNCHWNRVTSAVFGMACLAGSKVNIQHYSNPWIASLYPEYVPYISWVLNKEVSSTTFKVFGMGLYQGLPDHWLNTVSTSSIERNNYKKKVFKTLYRLRCSECFTKINITA